MDYRLRPTFIRGSAGDLFVLLTEHPAAVQSPDCILIVPPLAEELNKSRRTFHLQAVELARRGVSCAVVDLFGTGDSAGHFGEATWAQWLRDLDSACAWLHSIGRSNIVYIGLRMGALLALEHGAKSSGGSIVLWNPWLDGGVELNNVLRMRVAADKLAGGVSTVSVKGLRELLELDGSVEVGGYRLSRELAREMRTRKLESFLENSRSTVVWLDVGSDASDTLSLVRQRTVDSLPSSALRESRVVPGDRFWATAEIAVADELVRATTARIETLLGSG